MTTTPSYSSDANQRGSALSRSFLPLALITIGVVFLLGNLVPERGRGGLIVFGLGAAFLVGRLTTGRYGYAVPAGVLMAIGAYIGLQNVQAIRGVNSAGVFFVLVGLGFGVAYLVGLRPGAVWPLVPGTILFGLGLVLLGVTRLAPLASLSWIAAYWPVALVLLGVWLLLRESLPPAVRTPIATLGGLALLAYGILAAAASVAAGGTLARTGVTPGFAGSPFGQTLTLPDVPIAAGQTFTVSNTNGTTTIHGGTASSVHVTATSHFSVAGHRPDVQLAPVDNGVTLQASTTTSAGPFSFGQTSSVDYSIEVPADVGIVAQSSTGKVQVDGVSGPVNASTDSGSISLTNLGGPAQAQAASGAISLDNVAGPLVVSSTSGAIRGTQLQHVQQAQTSTGSIALEGVFTDATHISTSSGSITLRLLPGSAVQLDVHSASGSVEPHNLLLTGGATRRDTLSGALGDPAPDAILSVQTNSGSVGISQ